MLLIIEALLLILAALGQDHSAAAEGQIYPLDMAPDSVDDQYLACGKKMAYLVRNKYLKKESNTSTEFKKAWQEGTEVRFGSFASSSLDRKVAQGFGTKSCFEIKTCKGVNVIKYSKYPEQKEVLIPPNETFKVTAVKTRKDQKNLWCETVYKLESSGKRIPTRQARLCAEVSMNGITDARECQVISSKTVSKIKSSSALFLCSWLTCGIAMACLWPRSGKQDWATKGPSLIAACGPDLHATSARCGPDLGRNNVAMWAWANKQFLKPLGPKRAYLAVDDAMSSHPQAHLSSPVSSSGCVPHTLCPFTGCRVFTKVAEAAIAPMCERGVHVLNFLDDWLILVQSREQLCEHRNMVLIHLSHLGLRVNWEKEQTHP
ncbi:NAD(P)(+)--arginine ADP-ribosyltransferase 2-like [Pimephales promelas]|nr:NAD(P)(+)--arginine ADP-ribosyltransferase 2-like [Pimephales promelas]